MIWDSLWSLKLLGLSVQPMKVLRRSCEPRSGEARVGGSRLGGSGLSGLCL